MNVNRGLLFWGLALVTAGVVALGVQQGYLDRDAIAGAWRLWPVVLIAIGLSIILARTPVAIVGTLVAALVLGAAGGALISIGPGFVSCGGAEPTDMDQSSGAFSGAAASVTLDLSCGELDLAMTDGAGWEARTGATGERQPRLDATGDSLRIRSAEDGFQFGMGGGKQRWEIGLGSDPTYDLQVSVNAAETTLDLAGGAFTEVGISPNAGALHLDLSGSSVEDFRISMNAGSAELQTDAGTTLAGTIGMNAGSLRLCTAPEAVLRFRVDANVTFSHNLDDADSGLQQAGEETWTSPGFGEAGSFIDLRLEGNAASFELNPEGGCA
ncbi:MAG: LiaI-LiaF-like domain-containing protein [Candidatus Limnocylindria bacterium]